MLLNYNLDISKKSVWKILTPDLISRKLPLYVNEIGYFASQKNHFTERKGQKDYFLLYTVKGCGSLKYKNTKYSLPAGTASLIYCNNYQYYKTEGDIWDYRWIHFNGSAIKIYYELINENSLNPITINDYNLFEQTHNEILQTIEDNDITSKVNRALLVTKLLTICVDNKLNTTKDINKKHKSETEKVKNYIASNYDKKISLDELCSLIYISKYHFLKIFKTHTGMTPYEYLINYRINIAKQILKNSDLPINEISLKVGFNDESSFIKQFKVATNYTPSNYRRFMKI
jgi:AraC-like DNA-binding protein